VKVRNIQCGHGLEPLNDVLRGRRQNAIRSGKSSECGEDPKLPQFLLAVRIRTHFHTQRFEFGCRFFGRYADHGEERFPDICRAIIQSERVYAVLKGLRFISVGH
jgi:hypothetical protein